MATVRIGIDADVLTTDQTAIDRHIRPVVTRQHRVALLIPGKVKAAGVFGQKGVVELHVFGPCRRGQQRHKGSQHPSGERIEGKARLHLRAVAQAGISHGQLLVRWSVSVQIRA